MEFTIRKFSGTELFHQISQRI